MTEKELQKYIARPIVVKDRQYDNPTYAKKYAIKLARQEDRPIDIMLFGMNDGVPNFSVLKTITPEMVKEMDQEAEDLKNEIDDMRRRRAERDQIA